MKILSTVLMILMLTGCAEMQQNTQRLNQQNEILKEIRRSIKPDKPTVMVKSDSIHDLLEQVECSRYVFNRFCLGGDYKDLPVATRQQTSGDMITLNYGEGESSTEVIVVKHKVASVSKSYKGMTWEQYRKIRGQVAQKNGNWNASSYNLDTNQWDDLAEAVVVTEKGSARTDWHTDGISIGWVWAGHDAALSYSHDDMMRVKRFYIDDGF